MPSLSVTIIAKDEERNIARALASVADVANEIVVVDTGSTDRTVEIAREFGARVEHFAWIDDFSAAYNYCNSLATGDWLLMLDADEELLSEGRSELAACLEQERALAFAVLRQDLSDPSRHDLFAEMWQVRLLRNRDDLRFRGRFHHHFATPLEEIAAGLGLEVRPSSIRLRHYGYLSTILPEKHRRAARLLQMELTDRPGQFYYLAELGLTLLALGDAAGHESLSLAAQMIAEGDPQVLRATGQQAMVLEYVLANRNLPPDFPLSRAAARELALAHFPTAPPLLWHIAAEHHERGRFAECAKLLERLLAMAQDHSYDHRVSFNAAILTDDAQLNLGVCLVRLGELNRAKACFRKLLNSPTRGADAARNLQAIEGLRRR